jgi:uncharacterized repeat protein (TIGR01451 family)
MEDKFRRSQWRSARLGRLSCVLAIVAVVLGVTAGSASAWQSQSESSFTIEKSQEVKGSGTGFVQSELTAKVGETIDYKIVVTNTGRVPLKLSEFADVHCDAGTIAGGPGSSEIAAGASSTYTCDHVLTEAGSYSNTASVTGTAKLMCGQGFSSFATSNTVVAKVTAEPAASIEKLQEIKGSGAGWTKSELTAHIGQTVDYEIIVRNTGDVPVKLSSFTDTNCEGLSGGPGSSELAPGNSTTYTCDRVLSATGRYTNTATVLSTGNEHMCGKVSATTLTSNTVVVNVPVEERIEVKKYQRFGSEEFTTNKLTGKVGETVDYKIVVTNDGNASVQLEKITDANCTNMSAPSKAALAPTESAYYTCEHKLTSAAAWWNEATVETTSHIPAKSNRVEVEVKEEPAFTIVKEQKLSGESTYTTSKLIGKLDQTVEYQITLHNTGNVPLQISRVTDTNCSNLTGPSQPQIGVGDLVTYTCEHQLTSVGTWVNEAEAETCSCDKIVEKSNKVEVEVPKEERIEVKKYQRFGTEEFTTSKLTGKIGQTVDYKIVVTNDGNASVQLEKITDANCTNMSAPSKAALAPTESAYYTCEHKLTSTATWWNQATVETTSHIPATSNRVEVEVIGEPAFTVSKEQKLGEGGSFTTSKLVGALGETVYYRITVANTGNVPIEITKLADANCTDLSGPSQPTLALNEHATYTCEHQLVSTGTWVNEAEAEGARTVEKSNKVEVEVPTHEAFQVEKEQKLFGELYFTKAKLTAKLGETVDYQIVVKDTGTATITLSAINDPNCTKMAGPGQAVLKPGEQTYYTCEHVLATAGTWTNTAEVETTTAGKERSNTVEAEVPAQESLKVVKEQKLFGQPSFTREKLTGKVGETVDYQITVTNTGNTKVALKAFSDPNCTNIHGPGKAELAPGEETSYTCEHVLAAGKWINVATVETPSKSEPSNPVEAEATPEPKQQVKPECLVSESKIALSGATGSRRKPFEVRIPSLGIKEITFYLDGRKLRTLKASQARNDEFSLTINPRGLGYGAHRVSVKTVMVDSVCAAIARSGVFIHPKPQTVTPKFTG